MDIRNRVRSWGTVKKTYIVIVILLISLSLLRSVGFYYSFLEYKLNERRLEVMQLTVRMEMNLKSFYGNEISHVDLTNEPDQEKVLALNAIIQPHFDEISNQDSNIDIGYYDIRFDSIVAKAPNFKPCILQKIPKNDPCFKSYRSGKLELVETNTWVGWTRKGTISVVIPVSVDNTVIGHVWATIKTDDVYQTVFKYTLGMLGSLSFFFSIPLTVTFLLTRRIGKQLFYFAESIIKGDSVEIDSHIMPELSPLLAAANARSQQLRTYEAIVQHSNEAISTIDLDFKITSTNPAWQRMYGYTATEMLGRNMTLLEFSEELHNMQEDFEWVKSGKEIQARHVKHKKKDGKVIDVLFSSSPIRDNHDHIIGIMSIDRDVTERNQMEIEMKRLDRLNVTGQMAASIAHEIRNPMTTVRGFLQLLGVKPALIDYKSFFELMIEELDRANSIITEFLSLSRNKPIVLRTQNLNNIINKLLPMLQADALNKENSIIIEQEEIPDVELDEPEIRQVILNLARNGLESMSVGGVMTIKTYLEKDQIVMSFSDQGSGIPHEVLENIGKPFLTTKDNGAGLGLPVSYNIVYRHGGTISIETGPEGTTFLIKLPQKTSI